MLNANEGEHKRPLHAAAASRVNLPNESFRVAGAQRKSYKFVYMHLGCP